MTRRALLIGSQIEGLGGVEADLGRMRSLLGDRRFVIDERVGDRATRAGILDGYDRLIAESGRDDVAVIYYSGHGSLKGMVAQPDGARLAYGAHVPDTIPFIVPTDYRQSTDDDFRG